MHTEPPVIVMRVFSKPQCTSCTLKSWGTWHFSKDLLFFTLRPICI